MIDAHCHLDMLDDVDAVLERMRAAGVDGCVTIGVDAATNEAATALAAAHDGVWATVGLHPHDAKDRTDAIMARMRELLVLDHVVGIGEAGLDYHYDNSPRDLQREVFAEQVRIANDVATTLVIHTREAWDDTFDILEREGVPERVVFHCFTGGPREAERALAIGAMLSFSGIITFNSAGDIRDAARLAPLDHIVIETDAPFLTPVPNRGKRNEPAYVPLVAEAIATVKDVTADVVRGATVNNTRRLFQGL